MVQPQNCYIKYVYNVNGYILKMFLKKILPFLLYFLITKSIPPHHLKIY